MIIKQKQLYEANFNCIGYFLLDSFEKCEDRRKRKVISNLIKNLNEMYMYTNKLEIKLITNEYIKESQ